MSQEVISWKRGKEVPVPSMGIRFLFWVYRLFGRRTARFLVTLILSVAYPFLRTARHASSMYRKRWAAFVGAPFPGGGFKHLRSFAYAMLDRMACWGDIFPKENVRVCTPEAVDKLTSTCREGKGAFCIVSHLGNAELLRALIAPLVENFGRHIHVYLATGLSRGFNKMVKQINGKSGLFIHSVDELGVGASLDMLDYLKNGDCIIMAGDRSVREAGRANYKRDFLGKSVCFPSGTFRLASAMGSPVYSLFLVERKGGYDLYADCLSDGTSPAAALLDAYLGHLQSLCLRYPLNWYNFYPYWS